MGRKRYKLEEIVGTIMIVAWWFTLDLEQPTLRAFLFMAYAFILAWTELMPRREQALKKIEGFLASAGETPRLCRGGTQSLTIPGVE